jgi:CBS domain-containing protein
MNVIKIARLPAVAAWTTVKEAVALMVEKATGAVVVVSPQNRVLGIFTEHDNLHRVTHLELSPATTPLSKVMSAPVETASADTSVMDALEIMLRSHFRHMPVVDGERRLIGIVSLRYLLMRRIGEKEETAEVLSAYATAGGPG